MENYLEVNQQSWNQRVGIHLNSDFYEQEAFMKGKNTLKELDLSLLGDIKGKKILHLQCHFGQDTISMSRMGAFTTGVDLSDTAINKAREIANELQVDTRFVCCDIYDLPNHLNEKFDIVYTSYGTIIWLPDLDKWAGVIAKFLKPGGRFIFADFHPFVWMYDEDFQNIIYHYHNEKVIVDTEEGSYADPTAPVSLTSVTWNHSISEVVNSLIQKGITIEFLGEYNQAEFSFVKHTEEIRPGKYQIKQFGDMVPLVYSIVGRKV